MINLEQARKNIPIIIKKGLKEKNMNQTELAKAVGCDKTAINHYLSGSRLPSVDILISICDVLDIDLNSFKNRQFARATDIDSIPTNSIDILYSLAILIKSGNLSFNEQYGDWNFGSEYKTINDFATDFLKFVNTKYAKKDEILLDLINEFTKQLEHEKWLKDQKQDNQDDDLPF